MSLGMDLCDEMGLAYVIKGMLSLFGKGEETCEEGLFNLTNL